MGIHNYFRKRDQDFVNFVTSVPAFLILLSIGAFILRGKYGTLPHSIPLFDFFLIILAVFRLSELFVYDKVMRFFRKLFATNEIGLRRTVHDLFSCPWCVSVWAALVVVFFYMLTPFSWYVILILAVSGAASFIQIVMNLVGWSSEHTELEVKQEEKEIKNRNS